MQKGKRGQKRSGEHGFRRLIMKISDSNRINDEALGRGMTAL